MAICSTHGDHAEKLAQMVTDKHLLFYVENDYSEIDC